MPIEIRELLIKTEIVSNARRNHNGIKDKDVAQLKKTILEECKRMIADQTGKKNSLKR